jgi:hypothetical protein
MNIKSLLIVGALSLASLGIASAKSYDIILSNPTRVGATELKAGEYKLKVEGTQATFTDVQTSKTWTAAVKVENSAKKFDQTSLETTNKGDMDDVKSIELGGSNTKIEFGQ